MDLRRAQEGLWAGGSRPQAEMSVCWQAGAGRVGEGGQQQQREGRLVIRMRGGRASAQISRTPRGAISKRWVVPARIRVRHQQIPPSGVVAGARARLTCDHDVGADAGPVGVVAVVAACPTKLMGMTNRYKPTYKSTIDKKYTAIIIQT